MLGEAALCLAAGESSVGGGSWTPASALGQPLLDRLQAHAGVTFTVVDE
jgi:saccharopine dehydrogenase (NAD+, L-glutamate forming)